MAVHISEFNWTDPKTGKSNASQEHFLRTFYKDILPHSYNETQFVVLSGAMGSGKSLAVQYIISRLLMENENLKIGIGRMSIDMAKETFFKELKVMIPSEVLSQDSAESMTLINNSHVKCLGWGDKNVRKLRADNFHVFVLEEVTEDAVREGSYNLNKDALDEIIGRVRNPNGPNIIFLVTNPDDPEHWLHKEYIAKAGFVDGEATKTHGRDPRVHLFYSVTLDNPYLKESYRRDLETKLTPNQAKRYVFGKWVSVAGEGIYNEYNEAQHYFPDKIYEYNYSHPVILSFDFNTAKGKPMSACMSQFINDHFHAADEVVLENSNTRGVLEELKERGFFKPFQEDLTKELIIVGDAAGWASVASSDYSDYGLIEQYLNTLEPRINFKIDAPYSNPAKKERHALVNLYLKNFKQDIRMTIYAPLHDPTKVSSIARALQSTKMKKGSKFDEDDSNPMQHIGTTVGYALCYCINNQGKSTVTINF